MKDLGKLLSQAREMQKNVKKTQKDLERTIISAESNKGFIKLEISCSHKIKSILIEDEVLHDKKLIEKYLIEVFNIANRKIDQETKSKMSGVAGGTLPPNFKMPF